MITERHLQAIWSEQLFLEGLKTADGEPVEVLSAGIWNVEAGPDFLRAHLKIGEQELQGDIEIHLRSEGWQQHGHEGNPLYDNVILHVVLWEMETDEISLTSSGKPIPTCYLEYSLTKTIPQAVAAIDLDGYPYAQFVGSGRCASLLFDVLDDEKTRKLLRSIAATRLRNKFFYLSGYLGSTTYLLASGIAQALGYKHNSRAFLELFTYLLPFKEESAEHLFARSLASTGFFEEKFYERWKDIPKYLELSEIQPKEPIPCFKLRLDHIRPANHPIRRLFYLCQLLKDKNLSTMGLEVQYIWKEKRGRNLLEALLALIPIYEDPYWNSHYTFEPLKREKNIALIGKDLKKEIVVNSMLPLLFHTIDRSGDKEEFEAFFAFYESLNAPESRKATYLTQRLFHQPTQRELLKKSCYQQGALQIHQDYCQHYEASCRGCPFPDRQ
jgi:hypothetical protein